MQEQDRSGSPPHPAAQTGGTSLVSLSTKVPGGRAGVEEGSFTSQRVLMVPLDKVVIILQLAGSPFKSSSTENI